ncbi:MAG: N-acetyltransferase [Opitutus sp.]
MRESLGEDLQLLEQGPHGNGRVSLWWASVPTMTNEKVGVIGGFSADSVAAAQALLTAAERELRSRGCTIAVGPMNGSTWKPYRFVTEAGTEPAFFLEPTHPPQWPEWWRAAGYEVLANYYSTATTDLRHRDERLDRVAARMTSAGVSIRSLDAACFESELGRIYDVSAIAFQSNYLYTPQPKEAFVAQYAGFRERLCTDLVLLAEQQGRTIGYVFSLPDYAQAQRGDKMTTFIVKTLAVLPGREFAGLGALLLAEGHDAARRLGFTRGIHALMHETNQSRNLSAHYAHTIRRYALFSKRLSA